MELFFVTRESFCLFRSWKTERAFVQKTIRVLRTVHDKPERGLPSTEPTNKKMMNDERHGYCHVREIPNRRRPSDQLDGHRQRLIVTLDSKWVNGTTLTYHVMTNGSPRQEQLIQQAFQEWKDTGMGLEFQSVSDPTHAMIRIGFQTGDGSWSYVGRDVLNITNPTDRTMNIGWDNAQTYDTCLHEIGHALGFPHEHQNPTGGLVWDDEAVYASLGGPPNHWTRERTFHNILRKLQPDNI